MFSKRFEKKAFKAAVKDNVKTLYRKTIDEATPQQLFQAVSYAVKDVIIDDWIETQKRYDETDAKTVYYMSMEFLMGRALGNNLLNLTAYKEVKEALTTDTEKWNSSLNARLITADEIATITENKNFNSSTTTIDAWFYLDSNNQTQTATSQGASKYAWLFDYTKGCTNGGCNIEDSSTLGYWTSTPVLGNNNYVWLIDRFGTLHGTNVSYSDRLGVRPVITISKDIIS